MKLLARRRSRRLYFLMAAVGIGIGILAAITLYSGFLLLDVMHVPMDFQVAGKVGFNAGTDALHFGKTLPGGASMRKINLTNSGEFDVLVKIRNSGNLSSWIEMSEDRLTLVPGEIATVYYYVTVPENAALGAYNGTSTIIIKRKLF